MYALARPWLFRLDAEQAHDLSLKMLDKAHASGLGALLARRPEPLPTRVFGLDFPNPVGLAAGLDKDGAHIDSLMALGFGFVEIGTVTPRHRRATRSRGCSGFPPRKASSTGWASTMPGSTRWCATSRRPSDAVP